MDSYYRVNWGYQFGKFTPEPKHEHTWFICYKQAESLEAPAAYVVDCPCGARAKVFSSNTGLPEVRLEEAHPGGSPHTALFVKEDELNSTHQLAQLVKSSHG